MFMTKVLRYAERMGLDSDELLDMTVLEAMLKIDETVLLWKEIKDLGKDV